MKKFLFLLFFAPVIAFAAQGNPSLDVISKALSAGDVETLSKYFADSIEISIQDNEQTYTKTQAVDLMRTFFNNNKPKAFDQVHQGTSRENSDQYCIGNLSATTGKYRVYIYLKVVANTLTIEELRMDKE